MKKYYIEIVEDFDGTHYANLSIDGERKDGLNEYIPYSQLRGDIKGVYGIDIGAKSELKFERFGRKRYAYVQGEIEK